MVLLYNEVKSQERNRIAFLYLTGTISLKCPRFFHLSKPMLLNGHEKGSIMAASDIIKNTFAASGMSLLQTCPFDKLTILQICNHSGLGRQTFYNHFKDKYDLVNWIYDSRAAEIFSAFELDLDWSAVVCKIFIHFLEHKKYYRNIIKSNAQNSFSNYLVEHTRQYYINGIKVHHGAEEMNSKLLYTIEFNTYGAVNMSLKWIENGMKESPEEMTMIMMQSMPYELKKYFEFYRR